MIAEILASLLYVIEICTGEALTHSYEHPSIPLNEIGEPLLSRNQENILEEFKSFDSQDAIFQEFLPPENLEADPKAWRQSLPTFNRSFWECLKSVLLIQTVAGSLIGFVAVTIIVLDFSIVEWCYEETLSWNEMPMRVQRLRVTAQTVETFVIQTWDLCIIVLIFPLSLIKDLHLLTLTLLASFLDVTYRLYFQVYSIYKVSWMPYPLNALFCLVLCTNNYLLARYFCPHSVRKIASLFFTFSAQFVFGMPLAFFFVYILFPRFAEQSTSTRCLIAAFTPLTSAIPKTISRLRAQRLKGVTHPGTAHVLVAVIYGSTAIVFRVLQAELTSIGLFIALGIVHALIDLLERITVTMRDHIWEYLFLLVRRQRKTKIKYRSPRSRRFVADVSIQIIMQEATALITALGFINVYEFMFMGPRPFSNYQLISKFLVRASIGLSIDLVFNTISVLIQTRVMNLAVNRVWRKKWRHHMTVNALVVCFSTLYFGDHLFEVVKSKYDYNKHPRYRRNCTYPSYL